MPDGKPIVYILHGDDEFGIDKFIAELIGRMGDPALASLNLTRLDGNTASDDDTRTAVLSMPFLTERRLVILTNPLAKLSLKSSRANEETDEEAAGTVDELPGQKEAVKKRRDRFLLLLDSIPQTTALVLVIDDTIVRRKGEWAWEVLTPTHWLSRWAGQAGGRALTREFPLPRMEDLPAWIRKQAQAQGGGLSPQAALALAEHLGSDTLAISLEITKLLTYVNYKRPVEVEDVELLTAQLSLANIFKMVDALAEGNAQQTLRQLHILLDSHEPQQVFGMVVRQFRLLLQAREVLDEGSVETSLKQVSARVAAEVTDQKAKVNPYVAERLVKQAQRFSLDGLSAIYHRLLDFDLGMKTSQITLELAMDTLVAEMSQHP